MAAISNAEAALLGLLAEKPMYPYQIAREVKRRDMRCWTELSMSSIYKLLAKSRRRGLVTREDTLSPQHRLRALYTLSRKGRSALRAKIEALLSEPAHVRWPIDIGLYNCGLLPRKTVRAALARYRATLEERVKGYQALHGFLRDAGCPRHRHECAVRPIRILEAEMRWVDAYMKTMEG
ncbi:MAG: PadR family transcriptional regulator [Candidatus Aureabacteria bacterium]|jgi:DNA-binding PadR family transcriptional regulator|nr:PadR family transcriptional regulator [Candidatus Auribacterota bacterium]NLW93457.1 PadR family transcriptional regulator [Chlamydiota bacterium]HOE27173.1 PadR family transcriptional regulator [bacterium]HQM52284.1 PadR family transcriptional regulator [bacterium]